MEGGDGDAILLDVDAVLQGVGGANLADRESGRGRHGGQGAVRATRRWALEMVGDLSCS